MNSLVRTVVQEVLCSFRAVLGIKQLEGKSVFVILGGFTVASRTELGVMTRTVAELLPRLILLIIRRKGLVIWNLS